MDRKLFIYAVAILAVAWYFHDPVPKKFSQPWKLRALSAKTRFYKSFLYLPHQLGLMSLADVVRFFDVTRDAEIPKKYTMTDEIIAGVRAFVYRPNVVPSKTGFPALIYYHGGGWVSQNNTRYSEDMLLDLATNFDMIVVSVQYRLAPEHPFPVPFMDCLDVTKYVLTNSETLGINSEKIIIGGDSAGGNLAAAVALKLRDDKFSPMPKSQILLYPEVQALDLSLPSFTQNRNGPYLDAKIMATLWSLYTTGSEKYGSAILTNHHTTPEVKSRISQKHIRHEDLPLEYHYKPYKKPKLDFGNSQIWNSLKKVFSSPYLSPLIADNVKGVPEAYVYTAQFDVVRDEGLLYVKKLRDAGVTVTHVHGTSAFHGVCTVMPLSREGTECYKSLLHYLRETL